MLQPTADFSLSLPRRNIILTFSTTVRTISVLAFALAAGAQGFAQSQPGQFETFDTFLEYTKSASAAVFVRSPDLRSDSQHTDLNAATPRVRDAAALEEMRQEIIERYKGVHVSHSFKVDSQYYDCIDAMEQPSVRKLHLTKIATPPADLFQLQSRISDGNPKLASLHGTQNEFDEFGNATSCPVGQVPLRRLTLEAMSHFETLKDFHGLPEGLKQRAARSGEASDKASGFNEANGTLRPEANSVTEVPVTYKGAYMFQDVDNQGATSSIENDQPVVNPALGQVSSISAMWLDGGTGSNFQTIEEGFAVYPARYGDAGAHIFLFATPDNYVSGCFDTDCPGFVLTGQDILGDVAGDAPGTGVLPILVEHLSDGNWWVAWETQATGVQVLGYYPGEVFQGGQLSKNAQRITMGSEAAGTTSWPQIGNGQFPVPDQPSEAFEFLEYIDMSNNSELDKLTPIVATPACYQAVGPFSDGSGINGTLSNNYFLTGGPGGNNCQ
jgi:Neprosin